MPSERSDPGDGTAGGTSSGSASPVLILDTSAFFLTFPLPGGRWTVPRVEEELRDLRGKTRFGILRDEGMGVREPSGPSLETVKEAAGMSGDLAVLSETDISLLALALDLQGTVVTDDFAIQNTAHRLAIPVRPIIQRRAGARAWKIRCTGCGKYFDQASQPGEDCPVCGSPLKRKHK